jgi:tetratricopeptide (TPR) repeat protein
VHDHLSLELLRDVHEGTRSTQDLAALALAHLLELCPQCHRVLEAWRSETARDREEIRPVGPAIPPDRLSDTGSCAKERIDQLLALPSSRRAELLQQLPERFRGSELAALLLEEASSCLPKRIREAQAIASLSRTVLQHGEMTPETTILYARALAQEGNTLRAQGNLIRADELLGTARFLLEVAGDRCDPLSRAEIDRLEGSLRRGQDRFEEALVLFARATDAYSRAGLTELEARTLISLGMVWWRMGEVARAIEVTSRAEQLLGDRQSRFLFDAQHNLAWFHSEASRPDLTREFLERSRNLQERFGDPRTRLRRLWLEGHAAKLEGDLETAEAHLRQVRAGFQREGIEYDAALAGRDLAALLARQRRFPELEELTREIVAVFDELQVYPEADAARRFLEEATGSGSPTVH